MIYPVIPQDNLPVIVVHASRATVSRYRQISPRGIYQAIPATNWAALEADAILAVEAVGGAIWADDHYPCPDALAARAVWAE